MWQLLIILAIVLAIFGTKRFKNIGTDLGGAIKGFRNAMSDGEQKAEDQKISQKSEDASFENTPGKENSKSGS